MELWDQPLDVRIASAQQHVQHKVTQRNMPQGAAGDHQRNQ
jgi:hypothetical protein